MKHLIAMPQRVPISRGNVLKKSIPIISAVLLSALFIYAAYNKLIIYKTFVTQLKQSPVTGGFEHILAWLVPGIELTIPILFLFKRTRLTAFYASFFLMLLFTAYVFIVPHFFKQQTCSCGGIISTFTWEQHFYFNISFLLLASAGLIAYTYPKQKTG